MVVKLLLKVTVKEIIKNENSITGNYFLVKSLYLFQIKEEELKMEGLLKLVELRK